MIAGKKNSKDRIKESKKWSNYKKDAETKKDNPKAKNSKVNNNPLKEKLPKSIMPKMKKAMISHKVIQ